MNRVRAATRGSALALWQTRHIASLLAADDPELMVEEIVVSTSGDRRLDVAIADIGGKGVFVKEVQSAVLEGRADIAVHSGKDLPAVTPEGLVIAAVPERADPRDVLIGLPLDGLATGAVIATGSARRRVQLAALCSGLVFEELRGNIETRLARADEFDAIVLAAAGLDRLGATPPNSEAIPVDAMVPQVAQAALVVECRADDQAMQRRLASIEHAESRRCVDAERAFLARLGGDCSMPAGAHTVIERDRLRCTGVLAGDSRSLPHRVVETGDDPVALGTAVAERLLRAIG